MNELIYSCLEHSKNIHRFEHIRMNNIIMQGTLLIDLFNVSIHGSAFSMILNWMGCKKIFSIHFDVPNHKSLLLALLIYTYGYAATSVASDFVLAFVILKLKCVFYKWLHSFDYSRKSWLKALSFETCQKLIL